MSDRKDAVQIINSAIIRSLETKIDTRFEERLEQVCEQPAVDYLLKAIHKMAESEKISVEDATMAIVLAIQELSDVWKQYLMLEGVDRLKNILRGDESSEVTLH